MAAERVNNRRFAELLHEEKPLLVDFWAPWCVHCRRIDSAYEKIAEQYGDELVVAKVNIDEAYCKYNYNLSNTRQYFIAVLSGVFI